MYIWLNKEGHGVGCGPGKSEDPNHLSVIAPAELEDLLLKDIGLLHRVRHIPSVGGKGVLKVWKPLNLGRTSLVRVHKNREVPNPDLEIELGVVLTLRSPHQFTDPIFIACGHQETVVEHTFAVHLGEQELELACWHAMASYPFVYAVGVPLRWKVQFTATQ